MNKKQQSSNKRRKRASIGLAVCFAAAIVLTGAYTWRNYRANVKDEQAKIEEEQQAKEEEIKRNTEETSSIAKKALEDEEPVTKEDSQAANTAADGSTENRMDTWETDSTQTAGTAMNLNFGEDSQLLWPVDGNVLMSYSMDKTVYFSTLDQYRYNPAMIISGAVNDNVIAAAPGIVKSIDTFAQTGILQLLNEGDKPVKEVQVKVGDYLEAGNVIGYLEIPTKYYSLEGCNLYFEMLKDGQPVNPMDYLAEE
jgi:septal ring factor EnvC (AmiA/AmiB activator)